MADFFNYEKPEAQIKSGPDLSVENLPEQATFKVLSLYISQVTSRGVGVG